MSNVIQNLLKTYYGFGHENLTEKSLTNHEREISKQETFNILTSDEYIIDVINQNPSDKKSSTDGNVSNNNDNENNSDEMAIRSWRVINNDEDTNIENIYVNNDELIVDIKENQRDNISDDVKVDVNIVSLSNRDDVHDDLTTSHASIGILEAIVDDNISDVSSSLTLKKKSKKISRGVTSASIASIQLPSLTFNSPIRKQPTYNEVYYDMSNAFITEFPINLPDKFQNIKMLYLENNALEHLPDDLFINLKFLQWLDVRHNKLKNLPVTIKHHPSLETILLQANQFKRLSLELGTILSLKGLQIHDNPLIYPPLNILALGFMGIIDFLRKEWNTEHPDEIIHPHQEVKSALTILCHEPPKLQSSTRSMKIHGNSSTVILPKLNKSNQSIREKSWNYKPSNRCDDSRTNAILEEKLQWISKVKEKLNRQAVILQRIKDKAVLKNWRQDRRSYVKSIAKATNRTGDAIPFGVDYTDIPFLNKEQQQKQLNKYKRINLPTKDINTIMSDISISLQKLEFDKQIKKFDAATELKRLQNEIEKLSNLQRQIYNLKNQNQTTMSEYNDTNSYKFKKIYKPPPSIII